MARVAAPVRHAGRPDREIPAMIEHEPRGPDRCCAVGQPGGAGQFRGHGRGHGRGCRPRRAGERERGGQGQAQTAGADGPRTPIQDMLLSSPVYAAFCEGYAAGRRPDRAQTGLLLKDLTGTRPSRVPTAVYATTDVPALRTLTRLWPASRERQPVGDGFGVG